MFAAGRISEQDQSVRPGKGLASFEHLQLELTGAKIGLSEHQQAANDKCQMTNEVNAYLAIEY